MISDWIRGLRDPELLYKKLLLVADHVEDSAKEAFGCACATVNALRKFTWWCFLAAIGATAFATVGWLLLWLFTVEVAFPYQALLLLAGLAWAAFLILVALLLGAIEGIIRQFPRLERALSDVNQSIVAWLRIPAWIAFVALFLTVLMARFPMLRKPEPFLSLVGIVAVFGLASFLGVYNASLIWLRRVVFLQISIAVILLLIAPEFPHVTAWVRKQISSAKRSIGQHASPKQCTIDPDAPPPFFDAVSGEPLFWYSRRPGGGYMLWDAPGFDPDSNEELKPVRTKEERDEILSWLRAEARRNPKPVKVEPPPTPKRLVVRSADDIGSVKGSIGQQSQPSRISSGDPTAAKREDWGEFASEARRAIANDLLRQDEVGFGRLFTLQCISASQSRRRTSAYGVISDVVVVTVRFRLSRVKDNGGGSSWLKTYEIVESIAADQFQGLTSPDTTHRIVRSLKKQIQEDKEALPALRNVLKP